MGNTIHLKIFCKAITQTGKLKNIHRPSISLSPWAFDRSPSISKVPWKNRNDTNKALSTHKERSHSDFIICKSENAQSFCIVIMKCIRTFICCRMSVPVTPCWVSFILSSFLPKVNSIFCDNKDDNAAMFCIIKNF